MTTVFFRTLFVYFFLTLAIRLTGKRQVGELQIAELVTTFMLSELAVNPIQNVDLPVSYALIPVFVLLSAEVIVSFLETKWNGLRKIVNGSPSIIIKEGKIDQREMARARIGIDELMSELRLKDIADPADVFYAILEDNGKLSVFPKASASAVTCADFGLSPTEKGIAHALIVDGRRDTRAMEDAKKNDAWLRHYLDAHNYKEENVFLLTVNGRGDVNVVEKA